LLQNSRTGFGRLGFLATLLEVLKKSCQNLRLLAGDIPQLMWVARDVIEL